MAASNMTLRSNNKMRKLNGEIVSENSLKDIGTSFLRYEVVEIKEHKYLQPVKYYLTYSQDEQDFKLG